jgi:hypothetical protein
MAINAGPKIVEDGLAFCVDAANKKSYPGAGTTWTDLTANKNNSTLINGAAFDSADRGSIALDGTDDRVDATTLDGINFYSNPATVNFWIYLKSNSGSQYFFNKHNSSNNAFRFYGWTVGGDNFEFVLLDVSTNSGVRNRYSGLNTQILNKWTHLAFVSSGPDFTLSSNLNVYINGVLQTAISTINSDGFGSEDTEGILTIGGRYYDNNRNMSANFAIFQVYNRALSSAEILQNYNATKWRFQ